MSESLAWMLTVSISIFMISVAATQIFSEQRKTPEMLCIEYRGAWESAFMGGRCTFPCNQQGVGHDKRQSDHSRTERRSGESPL